MSEVQASQDQTRAFARRKWVAVGAGVGMIFGLTAVGFFNENPTLVLWRLTARGWQLVVILGMLALAALMVGVWRCPACAFFLGLAGDPKRCPRCQAQLRK